jgi:peroxiredoxin
VAQLGKLKSLLDENRKKEVELITVSVDSHEASRALIEKLKGSDSSFDFLLLEDKNHKVIDRYGLLNTSSPLGIPHPTTYVIDKRGVVVWKFTEVDYRIRPTNEMILEALKKHGL